ncbi:MAG: hypothetical protein ACSHX7_05205 [Luteolibacter sp.]
MKKLITTIAVSAFALIGTAVQAEARPQHGNGYHQGSSKVYVSGYRHGRPVYTQKVYVGRYKCGTPRYEYRTVAAPVSKRVYRSHSQHRGYNRSRSGASVSFHFGR